MKDPNTAKPVNSDQFLTSNMRLNWKASKVLFQSAAPIWPLTQYTMLPFVRITVYFIPDSILNGLAVRTCHNLESMHIILGLPMARVFQIYF